MPFAWRRRGRSVQEPDCVWSARRHFPSTGYGVAGHCVHATHLLDELATYGFLEGNDIGDNLPGYLQRSEPHLSPRTLAVILTPANRYESFPHILEGRCVDFAARVALLQHLKC